MIFLFNNERVLTEILQLAKMLISKELAIPEDMVQAKVVIKDGKITPSFGIGTEKADGPRFDDKESQKRVQSTIAKIWGGLQSELSARMKGLSVRRHGYGN